MAPHSPADTAPNPPRVIGPGAALAIVMGSMLGIGIFLTPPQVATHLPQPGLYLLAWAFGGLIAFSGAVAYAELGTRFPEAGGDYVFLRQAFGPDLSFAAGWVLFVGVFTGSVATMAVPLAQFQLPLLLEPLLPFDPQQLLWSWGFLELTMARALGVLIIFLLTGLNILGTRLSAGFQIALTAIPVVLLTLGALWIFFNSPAAMPAEAATTDGQSSPIIAFGRAVLAVYFAFAGWNAIAYVGGELKTPSTTIPRALLGGTAAITILYLILAGLFVYVLGIDGLANVMEAGTATADAVGGQSLAYFITLLIAIALVGSLNGTILAGARVALAMAKRGALAPAMGRLHHRFKTPAAALILQGLLAILFILTGTFEILLELTSVAMLLMGALTVWALFRIRRRQGDDAPYQATGYPVLPLFFLFTSLVVIGATIYRALASDEGLQLATTYPLLGLAIFILTGLAHRLWRTRGPQ